jgi:hypothetical protein
MTYKVGNGYHFVYLKNWDLNYFYGKIVRVHIRKNQDVSEIKIQYIFMNHKIHNKIKRRKI